MKVKYGSIITNSRGKLGGQYYSRNHYGPYAANIVTPTNPQTSYQSDKRAIFLYFTQNWRNLTRIQQEAWIAAAPDFPRTDVFGDPYESTGKNLYVSLNLNLAQIGETAIDEPPTPESIIPLPAISSFDALADYSLMKVFFAETLTDTTSKVCLYVTPPISPGYFNVTSKYKLLLTFNQSSSDYINFQTEYSARFPSVAVGQKVFAKFQTIQTHSGQRGVSAAIATLFA